MVSPWSFETKNFIQLCKCLLRSKEANNQRKSFTTLYKWLENPTLVLWIKEPKMLTIGRAIELMWTEPMKGEITSLSIILKVGK